MEAIALHDFVPNVEDELGFSKGSVLKILCVEDDPNWYNAEQDGRKGLVPMNYIDIKPNPWYIRNCGRKDAEERLLEKTDREYIQRDGAFIVRRSEATPRGFSLSVKHGSNVMHFKVLQDSLGKYFLWVYKFDSVNELIEHHKRNTISRTHTILLQNCIETPRYSQMSAPPPIHRVIARFDFEGNDDEELSFRRGDIIEVLSEEDENWWQGQTNGRNGLFPSNYVESLPAPAI